MVNTKRKCQFHPKMEWDFTTKRRKHTKLENYRNQKRCSHIYREKRVMRRLIFRKFLIVSHPLRSNKKKKFNSLRVKQNRHDPPHEQTSYSYALRAEPKERTDDDYDVIRRRDLDLLSCGLAAAVAGDQWRRCCLQRARAQWAPNQATARATAKCATRRNCGGGNTPTDGDRRRRAPKKRVCYCPLSGGQPYPVFVGETALLKFNVTRQTNCTRIKHHVKEAFAGRSNEDRILKKNIYKNLKKPKK